MFAILGESDDEDKVKVVKKEDKKKEAAPAKAAAAPAPAAPKAKAEKDGKEKRAPKDAKPREERPKSAPAAAPAGGDDEVAVKNPAGDRKHRDRGGRGKGGRGDRAAAEPAGEGKTRVKREFDRRNTSGRSGEQRRGGRGPYSTGNAEQEAQDAEKGVLPVTEGDEAPAEAEPVEAAAEPEVEAPAQPPQKTFEDFMREREEARANSEIFGSVKVREVAADFANLRAADKSDITFVGGFATGPAKKANTKERKTRTLLSDVGFTSAPVASIGDDDRDYKPNSAPAGGRGDRGRGDRGGRGGRGRGRDGPRPSGARGPNFGDELSFPAL